VPPDRLSTEVDRLHAIRDYLVRHLPADHAVGAEVGPSWSAHDRLFVVWVARGQERRPVKVWLGQLNRLSIRELEDWLAQSDLLARVERSQHEVWVTDRGVF
jgi:hypothetical protein